MKQQYYSDPIAELEQKIVALNLKIKVLQGEDYDFSTFILGQTGAGKSTLANALLHNDLDWVKKGTRYLCKTTEQGPKIGNKIGTSQTNFSDQFTSEDIGKIFDNPGMIDTRGDVQDIMNNYCITSLFKAGKSIKLVIVIQFSDFQAEKGTKISEIIALILQIFRKQNNQQLADSCLITVSKILGQYFKIQQIAQWMIQILEDHKKYDELKFAKQIVKKNRILFFPKPENQALKLDHNSINKIRQTIKAMKPYTLKNNASLSLSNKSKRFLSQLAAKASRNLQNQSINISENIKKSLQQLSIQQKSQRIRSTKAIICQNIEHPRSLQMIEQSLQKLSIPKPIAEKTVSQLHKLQFCQKLQPNLKISDKSKKIIYEKLLESVNYSFIKTNRQLAQHQNNTLRMTQFKKIQDKQLESSFNMQKNMLKFLDQHMQNSQKANQIARNDLSSSMENMMSKKQQQQRHNLEMLTQEFKQSKWKNYEVHITTRICQIM